MDGVARYSHALIGMPTGERTGLAVLDVDMKNGKNGLRTLARAARHRPSCRSRRPYGPRRGGLHLHFQRPEGGFGNTVGAGGRGIGDGLDWRCDGGYVVLPAPGSGYRWDEHSYETCTPIDVPEVLLPRQRDPDPHAVASGSATGGAITRQFAVRGRSQGRCGKGTESGRSGGERNALLFWGACRFGEAIAQGLIGEDDARRILHEAAARTGLPSRDIAKTIDSAFRRAVQ